MTDFQDLINKARTLFDKAACVPFTKEELGHLSYILTSHLGEMRRSNLKDPVARAMRDKVNEAFDAITAESPDFCCGVKGTVLEVRRVD